MTLRRGILWAAAAIALSSVGRAESGDASADGGSTDAATEASPAPPTSGAPNPAPPSSVSPTPPAPEPSADGGTPIRPDESALHSAFVHLHADYPSARLELRSYIDDTNWKTACEAPCDLRIRVEGMEARVVAAGMSASNVFRIEPGRGTANLRVEGGSTTSRTIGTAGLIAGIPLGLTGMGLFGYGKIEDKSGLRAAGIASMAVAAVLVVGSLPFLSAGSTRVRNGQGKTIARSFSPPPL